MSGALAWGLGLFVVGIVAQRLAELAWSARTAASLAARGAIEHGAPHFPLMVVLHTLFPVCLVAEVLWLEARPGPLWPLWLCSSFNWRRMDVLNSRKCSYPQLSPRKTCGWWNGQLPIFHQGNLY